MAKAPTISAGSSSSNDGYSVTEDQIASTTLFLNVLTNDPKKSALYSLDNGDVGDLLIQDVVGIPELSRLGASISITATGQIAYSLGSLAAQSLAQGETMIDSFLYALKLTNGAIVWQTVTVTITGTNDAPIARADVATATEDSIATGSVATNDSDIDHGAVLRFTPTGELPAGFAMASNGSWTLDATNPVYQSLGAGEVQQVTITYAVNDEHGASAVSSLTLTVTGTNDAPQVSGAVSGSAVDGGNSVTLDALANASDADHGAVLWVVNVPAAHDLPAGVSYDTATHLFTLDPAAYRQLADGEIATVRVVYGVSDGTSTTPASVSWTVTGANDAPVTQGGAATVSEDQSISGQAVATDADHGAQLSYAADALPGFAMAPDGSWTFDASQSDYQSLGEGQTVQIVVPYTVRDEHGSAGSASIQLTLVGSNDAPQVSGVVTGNAIEGANPTSLSALANASDVDANSMLSIVNVPATADLPAGVTYNPATGTFTLDPSHSNYDQLGAGETSVVTVHYGVSDGMAVVPASVSWTVTGTNDIPVATPTFGAIAEDQILSGQLLATDADRGATLSYSLLGLAPEGFHLNADGSWTFDTTGPIYQPAPQDYSGDWVIRYRVTDEHGDATEASLTLTLSGTNDAPITTPAGAYVTEGSTASGQLVAIDRDEGAQIHFTLVHDPLPGFMLDASGAWSLDASNPAYAELAAGQTGILWVDYLATDEFGASTPGVLGLEFTGINSAPVRSGPSQPFAGGTEDTPYIVTRQQLLSGWSDPEHGALSVINLNAAGATVTANPDGSFTITPGANFSGALNLSYGISDGSLVTDTAVQLIFQPVNDPAVIGGAFSGSVTEATSGNAGTPVASGLLTISDPDSPASFIAINGAASNGGYGSVTLTQSGSWQYLLNNGNAAVNALSTGQSLTDSFTVVSSDGTSHGVIITINGATDIVVQPLLYWGTGDPNDFSGPIPNGNGAAEVTDTAANDTLVGTDADQVFYSFAGNDTIYGQGGNDRIYGLGYVGGTFYGQAGDDFITLNGSAPSTSFGGTGSDEVRGGGGNDILYGGSGIDNLLGFGGNDILIGGFHIDNLTGGAGADTFRFLDLRDTGDHLLDFAYGEDILDYAALDANQQMAGDQSFAWSGTNPTAYSLWMQVVNGHVDIYADTDGNPLTAEFMISLYNSNFATAYVGNQPPTGIIF